MSCIPANPFCAFFSVHFLQMDIFTLCVHNIQHLCRFQTVFTGDLHLTLIPCWMSAEVAVVRMVFTRYSGKKECLVLVLWLWLTLT